MVLFWEELERETSLKQGTWRERAHVFDASAFQDRVFLKHRDGKLASGDQIFRSLEEVFPA